MRKTIIAGNWKMNMTLPESLSFIHDLKRSLENKPLEKKEIMIFPPFPFIAPMIDSSEKSPVFIGAQNAHHEIKGAFTGEVSAPMVRSTGATHVIIGHSERREYFSEDNNLLNEKIKIALHYGLKVIYCCGETLEQRKQENHKNVVQNQINVGLKDISVEDAKNLYIAYEPVWAIGTGETATPEQAQEMHSFIRKELKEIFSENVADSVCILYGGSMKPANAKNLLKQKDIDGGLVGGASLNVDDFLQIIQAI